MHALEVVKSFYQFLADAEVAPLSNLLSDRITWTEAETFPYYGGIWRTGSEVIENLLVPLGRDWDGFIAQADSFAENGDEVIAFGFYKGMNRKTKKHVNAPFAHRWRVDKGKIVSFVQYTDTMLFALASSPNQPTSDMIRT